MQIAVDSKRHPLKKLQKFYPGAKIIDLTSKALSHAYLVKYYLEGNRPL